MFPLFTLKGGPIIVEVFLFIFIFKTLSNVVRDHFYLARL